MLLDLTWTPLTSIQGTSGEASALNRRVFQRIRPWNGWTPGPFEDDVAHRVRAEHHRVVARDPHAPDLISPVVDFQGGHESSRVSGGRPPIRSAEVFLREDLELVPAAGRDHAEPGVADLGGLLALVADFELFEGRLGPGRDRTGR